VYHWNPMFGRKHTTETKEKMRKARIGRKFPRKSQELIMVSEDAIETLSKLANEEINKTRNDSVLDLEGPDVTVELEMTWDTPWEFDEFGKPK
jgi:hypothetical protein